MDNEKLNLENQNSEEKKEDSVVNVNSNVPSIIEEELKKLPSDFSGTVEIPLNSSKLEALQNMLPGAKPLPEELKDLDNLFWNGEGDTPMINYGDEYVVVKGETLEEGHKLASNDDIINAIKTVSDPEIMVNVFDLGLIYRMDHLVNGDVEIDMTVTAPSCPVAGVMPNQVAEAVSKVDGVGKVTVKLVWEPAWSMDRMSEDAKFSLDLFE
ncbi:MAG: iron-sulfur cluster assembly protein [Alphaproteobacteria bacterium]|nr:iron-sulfur cluster assembly protein [Alphaproteobacteria bacterium]